MERRSATQLGLLSAWALLAGVLLSGPLTVIAVSQVAPQPAEWSGIATYARAFHPLQLVTFGFGFLIILGALGLFSALHVLASPARRVFSLLALVMTAVFASIIATNYMFQLAVLRANVRAGHLEGMELFAFNNPDSVAMALELLGYGFLGVATWAIAPLFGRTRLERWVRGLGIANGVVSLLGTALQASVGLRGLVGLVAYAGWNVLFAALCVLFVIRMHRVHRRVATPPARELAAWAW